MRIFLLAASAPLLLSCSSGSPSAGQQAAASPARQVQVVIASKPAGASVLLQGARVGETPVTLQVKEDTNLVLELDGYVRQALLVTPDGRPNHVVELIPAPASGCCPCAAEGAAPNAVAGAGARPAAKPPAASTASTSSTATAPELPRPKAATGGIRTMREAKEAYRAGRIDRSEYNRVTDVIRGRMRTDIDELKRAYRAGKVTKADYEQGAREIKLRYEG
jgi:hypothetical protein